MNLKKLKDDLYVSSLNNRWTYKEMPHDLKGNFKGIKVSKGKKYYVTNNVYSLFEITETTRSKNGKIEEVSKSEVIDYLKHDYSPETLIGDRGFTRDLIMVFKHWLVSVVYERLEQLKTTNKDIPVNLHLIKSSSKLTEHLVSKLTGTTFNLGKYNLKFYSKTSFEKGSNIDFDVEAYVDSLRTKNDFDEDKAIAKGEELRKRVLEHASTGNFSLHNLFGGSKKGKKNGETYLRKYITGLTDYTSGDFDAVVEILIDDFFTTGTTLRSMYKKATAYKDDSLIFMLTIFKI